MNFQDPLPRHATPAFSGYPIRHFDWAKSHDCEEKQERGFDREGARRQKGKDKRFYGVRPWPLLLIATGGISGKVPKVQENKADKINNGREIPQVAGGAVN